MANPQHLALIQQGVDVWNEWRQLNPKIRPDLREADLKQLNLKYANFEYADLSQANLRERCQFDAIDSVSS